MKNSEIKAIDNCKTKKSLKTIYNNLPTKLLNSIESNIENHSSALKSPFYRNLSDLKTIKR